MLNSPEISLFGYNQSENNAWSILKNFHFQFSSDVISQLYAAHSSHQARTLAFCILFVKKVAFLCPLCEGSGVLCPLAKTVAVLCPLCEDSGVLCPLCEDSGVFVSSL